MSQTHWVMDYETLCNCFLGVFEHYKTKEERLFTIGLLRNDLAELLHFFDDNRDNNEWHISFNGLNFDAQITEYIMRNRKNLVMLTGEQIAVKIYLKAQDCIERSRNRDFQEWSEGKLSIRQIDLFKLNHWDNPAKRSSLKWIQCSMQWHNVQDMPIDHKERITTVEQLKEIAMYCRNDVASTKRVMENSNKLIALRGTLTHEYGINLYSASEPRISKELFLHFMAKKTGIPKYELKHLRTQRIRLIVKDLILPYIGFTTPEFQTLHKNFSGLALNPFQLKGQFNAAVEYRGVKTKFGLGGVHGAKKGIYEPNDQMIVMSSDVVSYYPNLAIRNGWSPAQLPTQDFCEQYEWFFDERRKIPKSDPRNYVYKIILNSTYGLSNDKHSFLYDPEFTMRITINGQLSLMMLYERVTEEIPGAVPIMQNTDGIEMMIPKQYKDKYLQICKEWEQLTKLELEHDQYQKLIVPDVNNYIGIFESKEIPKVDFDKMKVDEPWNYYKEENGKCYTAKVKTKGRFEIDKPMHKNRSFMVVPKALFHFFVYGTLPEDYIKTNTDVFDYCGQTRAQGVWKFKHTYVDFGDIIVEDLQKTLRYLVTNEGTKIVKNNTLDGRNLRVEAGEWKQTVFNVFEAKPFAEYDINFKYYLTKARKEITGIQPGAFSNQINLF